MVEPRAAVKAMRAYSPPTGDRIGAVRLDFNENTVGCSPRVAAFLRKVLDEDLVATYPGYADTIPHLAEHFSVADGELALTNGTDEAIQLLVNTFVDAGDEVVIPSPTYAMYRFYAEVAGARVVEVPVLADDPWQTPGTNPGSDQLLSRIGPATKAVFISNPNNPTGSSYTPEFLRRLLDCAPGACVLVDEAYFEFHGATMLPFLSKHPNLFMSRTFSKAYGLAALRVGCLFSQSANIASVRKCQSPYSVNMIAALAATEAVRDDGYVATYVQSALEGRRLTEEGLDRLGYRFLPSRGNFVLFDSGAKAGLILANCGRGGIRIRDRGQELPGALRVTAGTREQAARFISVLEALS